MITVVGFRAEGTHIQLYGVFWRAIGEMYK